MNRRDFLKLSGVAAAAGAAATLLPGLPAAVSRILYSEPELSFGSRLLKGTHDGLILASADEGKTWQRLANFGSHLVVLKLSARKGEVIAKVGLGENTFALRSSDGRTWRTV